MSNASAERRLGARRAMVLATEVVELPRGAKLTARTADISRTGCYIDTLNPIGCGSQVRVRVTHNDETFEALGQVVYVSPGLGMGVSFAEITPEQIARLESWLKESGTEF